MLDVLFAGLAPFFAYYGIGAVIIAVCIAWFFFAPDVFGFKKTALWVASVVAYSLFLISVGVKIEHARNAAKETAVAAREEAVSNRERDVIARSIKPEPRSVRGHCQKSAHDRC